MRGVVDEFYRENKNDKLFYFPSYEILLYMSMFSDSLYCEDMIHPHEKAIEMVASYFEKYYFKK